MKKLEKVTFYPQGEDPVEFYVLEQTRLGGYTYLLATELEDGDAEAWILKDISKDGDAEGVFTIVSDEQELAAVAGVFEHMLDDVTFV